MLNWQRVLHGCGGAIGNAARVHSMYEFTLAQFPGHLIRVKILETPEGLYFGVPDHAIETNGQEQLLSAPANPVSSPEKALQEATCHFIHQIKPGVPEQRLVRVQNW